MPDGSYMLILSPGDRVQPSSCASMGYQAQMMGTSDQYVAPGFIGVNPVPGLLVNNKSFWTESRSTMKTL